MALLFDEIGASAANAAAVIRLAPLAAQKTKGYAQSTSLLAEMPG